MRTEAVTINEQQGYVGIDSGASFCMITDACRKKLGITKFDVDLDASYVDDKVDTLRSVLVLVSYGETETDTWIVEVRAAVLPSIRNNEEFVIGNLFLNNIAETNIDRENHTLTLVLK
jgi:hypothetical protein